MTQDEAAQSEVIVDPNPEPGGGVVSRADYDALRQRDLLIPLEGADPAGLRDSFTERRGSSLHEATDIPAAVGAPVIAVENGAVAKLFYSVRGGLTVYQFDPTERYCYYYAHLDRYAEGLHEGQALKRGDRIGYVGSSGDAAASEPHLHFAIFKLGPERHWWQGTAIDPYSVLRFINRPDRGELDHGRSTSGTLLINARPAPFRISSQSRLRSGHGESRAVHDRPRWTKFCAAPDTFPAKFAL